MICGVLLSSSQEALAKTRLNFRQEQKFREKTLLTKSPKQLRKRPMKSDCRTRPRRISTIQLHN